MLSQLLKKKRFWLLVVLVGLVLTPLILSFIHPGVPPEHMPVPNGFDDFAKAEAMLKGGLPDISTMGSEQLTQAFSEHAESLKLARSGLSKDCRVVLDRSAIGWTNLFEELALTKTLGLLLMRQGDLAQTNGDPKTAFEHYLEALQFTSKRFNGGLLLHKQVAAALSHSVETRLEALLPKLKQSDCTTAIDMISELQKNEEPLADVAKHDLDYGRAVTKISMLQALWLRLLPNYKKAVASVILKLQQAQNSRSHLLLAFASRAYELDTGKPPAQTSDLVPKYLPTVPKDAITGAELTLNPSAPATTVRK